MGLMFDDDNEVACPDCGCKYVYEREESLVDKIEDQFDCVYIKKQTRWNIRCAQCGHLIASNIQPKLREVK